MRIALQILVPQAEFFGISSCAFSKRCLLVIIGRNVLTRIALIDCHLDKWFQCTAWDDTKVSGI
jgi:hypothetical protein